MAAGALPTVASDFAMRVDVGGVYKVDPGVEGAVDDADRLVVVRVAHVAEYHGAEARLADRDAGPSQATMLHQLLLSERRKTARSARSSGFVSRARRAGR